MKGRKEGVNKWEGEKKERMERQNQSGSFCFFFKFVSWGMCWLMDNSCYFQSNSFEK